MSSMNIEKYTNAAFEEGFVELEASSHAEVARAILLGFGTLFLLSAGTYIAAAVLSTVLAALLF